MAKNVKINPSSNKQAKRVGYSSGTLTLDPILKDMVTPKVLKARKKNNASRYATKE